MHRNQMSPFKSAEESVQLTTGSRGVCISGCNAGYTMFRGSVKSTGYPLHLPVSPSLPLPCASVCHHISTGLYQNKMYIEKNSILWGAGPIGVGWGITYHACHIVYLKSSHQQHHLNVLPAKRQVQISFFRVGNSVFLPDMAQRSHLKLRCHVVIT